VFNKIAGAIFKSWIASPNEPLLRPALRVTIRSQMLGSPRSFF
jgi:hypothetical protein